MTDTILEMKNINKSFPGVKALDHVNLSIKKGEVHALIGENGAGKSTLMKILSGVYQMDSGDIFIEGEKVQICHPEQAAKLGISIIYQELNLVPDMSIAENIFMGRERRKGPMVDFRRTNAEAAGYIREVGLDLHPEQVIRDLPIAQRQLIEVAKALSVNAKVIVMDEPTSSLTEKETDILMNIIRQLREKGTSVVFISHKLNEIFEISDRITVMRDGVTIQTVLTEECSESKLISMMVGRPLTDLFPKVKTELGEVVLKAEHISSGSMVHDVSFSLRKGEILGFYGLVGAGRSELMSAIFGVEPMEEGHVQIGNKVFKTHSPSESIKCGLGLVPEDRKLQGLVLGMSVKENVTLADLEELSRGGFISGSAEQSMAERQIKDLSVKTPGIDQKAGNLSGGNQQKVVIGKWLAAKSKVLILDEPTRGIDVGSKKEIYTLMGKLVSQGVAIIMVSSELPEILGMSDRVIIMNQGRICGELSEAEASQERIMSIILKSKDNVYPKDTP